MTLQNLSQEGVAVHLQIGCNLLKVNRGLREKSSSCIIHESYGPILEN